MKFYSWKDIERFCKKNREIWEQDMEFIDVYPDEVILYLKERVDEQRALCTFTKLFPKNIDLKKKKIQLDDKIDSIDISFDTDHVDSKKQMLPLFEKVIYEKKSYPEKKLSDLECPVIAFHSYKGGVGRTLTLLAFAKAWTNIRKNKSENKLLIIDSDLEAPGLTWIQGDIDEDAFSYLDLLTLIQDNDNVDDILSIAKREIGRLNISIETDQEKVDHYFLPTFRYEEQLYDLYASPNTIIKSKNKQYYLAEILAKIAKSLNISAVLVDLRAGISEYSAPLLFDPRVKKYFVTSTSSQSVIGTKKLLEYVSKGLKIEEDSILPTILLNMIPNGISKDDINTIYSTFLSSFKSDERDEQLLDNIIVECPFASELVHLTSIEQIINILKDRELYVKIEQVVQQYYSVQKNEEIVYTDEERKVILKKIHEYADKQITAEANGALELLLTQPIKNLCQRFKDDVPNTVVMGAKGSGKTFLYSKLLEKQEWYSFCDSIVEGDEEKDEKAYFIPLIAPKNMSQWRKTIEQCIHCCNENVEIANVETFVYLKNTKDLEVLSKDKINWVKFWEEMLSQSVNEKYKTLDEVNKRLGEENNKIVFLIDGLEEILKDVSTNKIHQEAIQVLCQDIMNELAVKYENIGMIIFLRSDMAQNAITINYEQFKQSYAYAELKWTSDEALKLAVWLVGKAVDGFYDSSIPIENASKEAIDKYLKKLWGLKLGKNNSNEAYSSRWILAALSDFNGRLQARDIIRFLQNAAYPSDKKAPYRDRIFMPAEIRKAVSICSEKKIEEIKTEYKELEPIFLKLENLEPEEKVLPLNLTGNNALSNAEEKVMIQEGYLTRYGGKLYLPEIVRHALGFKYGKGARPKVLSLFLKH